MSARTPLMVTDEERNELRRLAKHPSTRQALATRCKVILLDLTAKQLRRGVFKSVASLEKTALEYLDSRNDDAKPFIWTADADTILGRVAKHHATISKSGH